MESRSRKEKEEVSKSTLGSKNEEAESLTVQQKTTKQSLVLTKSTLGQRKPIKQIYRIKPSNESSNQSPEEQCLLPQRISATKASEDKHQKVVQKQKQHSCQIILNNKFGVLENTLEGLA
ncbi:hypothetical protein CARUB_v10010676mg [Capsella rubella]|uniref:Uncharacterized protein n=1 Tax=Capsella rubella TaxID=81985 RepID=R0IFU7_9BRAS|nr:hypothetical protein CARUB_v10010676mg [Capsella rubella]